MNREFHAPRPNALWLSDFTYVATWAGFVYVALVIDAFARKIVESICTPGVLNFAVSAAMARSQLATS